MKKSSLLTSFIIFFFFLGLVQSNAQDLKSLKKQIKEQEAELRVNEEMLLSGVESLENTN